MQGFQAYLEISTESRPVIDTVTDKKRLARKLTVLPVGLSYNVSLT